MLVHIDTLLPNLDRVLGFLLSVARFSRFVERHEITIHKYLCKRILQYDGWREVDSFSGNSPLPLNVRLCPMGNILQQAIFRSPLAFTVLRMNVKNADISCHGNILEKTVPYICT